MGLAGIRTRGLSQLRFTRVWLTKPEATIIPLDHQAELASVDVKMNQKALGLRELWLFSSLRVVKVFGGDFGDGCGVVGLARRECTWLLPEKEIPHYRRVCLIIISSVKEKKLHHLLVLSFYFYDSSDLVAATAEGGPISWLNCQLPYARLCSVALGIPVRVLPIG